MSNLICIGEVLIDLTQVGVTETGIPQFVANPGGAPANAAVAASKLGADAAFIGCVGNDAFGSFLKKTLDDQNVNTKGLAVTSEVPTTMAVVSVDETGERSFQFYRKPGADLFLDQSMIDADSVKAAKILHFGSVSLTANPSKDTCFYVAKLAKENGALITYDPNYRANLWDSREVAIEAMREPLPLVDVLKISDEETELLSGIQDPEGAAIALEEKGIKLVLVTLGADGVLYRFRGKTGKVAGFPTKVADTNGAGDTFFGAVLSWLEKESLENLTEDKLKEILKFANCAASLTTSRSGAIPAMPTLAEVEEKLN